MSLASAPSETDPDASGAQSDQTFVFDRVIDELVQTSGSAAHRRSGGASFVAVMEAADLGDLYDTTDRAIARSSIVRAIRARLDRDSPRTRASGPQGYTLAPPPAHLA